MTSGRGAVTGAADCPGSVAAGGGAPPLGHGDLLLPAVLVRAALSAVRVPGAEVELQPAVVAVAGVDVPVSTGLAGGDRVPDAVVDGLGAHLDDRRRGRPQHPLRHD